MKILPNSKIIFEIRRGEDHPIRLQEELDKRGIKIQVEQVFRRKRFKNYIALPVELKPNILYKYVKIIDNVIFR